MLFLKLGDHHLKRHWNNRKYKVLILNHNDDLKRCHKTLRVTFLDFECSTDLWSFLGIIFQLFAWNLDLFSDSRFSVSLPTLSCSYFANDLSRKKNHLYFLSICSYFFANIKGIFQLHLSIIVDESVKNQEKPSFAHKKRSLRQRYAFQKYSPFLKYTI